MEPKEALSGSRMERKREETTQKIIAAAVRLFQQHGLDATTMEQIAADADIAKGTLYHYFPVKEAIIDELIERSSKEINAERILRIRTLPDTRTRLTTALNELMEGVRARKDIFEKYFVYRIQNMISLRQERNTANGFAQLASEIIRLGQQSGELRTDLPPDALQALFEFAFIKIAQQLYQSPQGIDTQEVVAQYVDLFMKGASHD